MAVPPSRKDLVDKPSLCRVSAQSPLTSLRVVRRNSAPVAIRNGATRKPVSPHQMGGGEKGVKMTRNDEKRYILTNSFFELEDLPLAEAGDSATVTVKKITAASAVTLLADDFVGAMTNIETAIGAGVLAELATIVAGQLGVHVSRVYSRETVELLKDDRIVVVQHRGPRSPEWEEFKWYLVTFEFQFVPQP